MLIDCLICSMFGVDVRFGFSCRILFSVCVFCWLCVIVLWLCCDMCVVLSSDW